MKQGIQDGWDGGQLNERSRRVKFRSGQRTFERQSGAGDWNEVTEREIVEESFVQRREKRG